MFFEVTLEREEGEEKHHLVAFHMHPDRERPQPFGACDNTPTKPPNRDINGTLFPSVHLLFTIALG